VEEDMMRNRFDDGNGTTVEITAPVTNERGTKDKCFTVIEAPGLRVRVTTHRSGRHWVELQEVNRRTTILGPPGDVGDGDVTVIKTPFTGDVAHNYKPKRRLVAIDEDDAKASRKPTRADVLRMLGLEPGTA
jgi:hypothetical protein